MRRLPLRVIVLSDGEFHVSVWEDGVEVWVTQMGTLMNMNTAFIDRDNGVVAIIDPFNAKLWTEALEKEGLEPTHLLYTCLLYTSPSPRDRQKSRMPSSA